MRLVLTVLALAFAGAPAMAANARHPYANIDRRVDAGNDTGDSQVDQLNRAQLDENFYGGRQETGPGLGGYPAPGYPMPPAPYAR